MKDKKDKMCLNKALYITLDEAEKAQRYCERQRNVKLRVYKCPYCKGYHLTSKEEY